MDVIKHEIVDDRVIMGDGTDAQTWQHWQGLQQLPVLDIKTAFPKGRRVCILAPHPDDEILGCGGLIQQLVAQGNPIVIIAVTNGTASHAHSTQYSASDLNDLRPQETKAALHVLGVAEQVKRVALNLPDGQVYQQKNSLYLALEHIIQEHDILVATFAQDGHPDHEGTGKIAEKFARDHGLLCYQVLIWAWHWAVPNDARIPWSRAQRLELSLTEQQKKRDAMDCFKTQIEVDPTNLNPPILSTHAIERICQVGEVYIC